MNFIVKRSEWLRGEGGVLSKLLRSSDRKRCCIGFVGQQLGIPDDALAGKRTALDSIRFQEVSKSGSWPAWMLIHPEINDTVPDSDIDKAYQINDSRNLNDAQREAELQRIFERNGDSIQFVD